MKEEKYVPKIGDRVMWQLGGGTPHAGYIDDIRNHHQYIDYKVAIINGTEVPLGKLRSYVFENYNLACVLTEKSLQASKDSKKWRRESYKLMGTK